MKQIIPGLWDVDEIGGAVHCYLWEWTGGVTLIDSGLPTSGPRVLDALRRQGFPLHLVRRIIITHGDADHMGGAAQLKRATQAPITCHAVEKDLLQNPARRRPASIFLRPIFWLVKQLPAFRARAVRPDELVVDGDTLPEGFIVVHTPGHTAGHISLLHREKRLLIAGDALSNRGGKLTAPPALFTPDMPNAQRSIWKLAKKYGDDYETIVFGHGPPILNNGGRRVKALASQIFSTDV